MRMKLMVGCLFFALVGCAQPPLNSGVVVSKDHKPEKTWVQFSPTQVGKVTMITPIFHRSPECWILVIQDDTVKIQGKESRPKQKKLYVAREIYESISVGDTYTVQVADKAELPIETRQASKEEELAYGPR